MRVPAAVLLLLVASTAIAGDEGGDAPALVEIPVGDIVRRSPERSVISQVTASGFATSRDLRAEGGCTFAFSRVDIESGRSPLVDESEIAYMLGCLIGDEGRVGRMTAGDVLLVPAEREREVREALARVRALRTRVVATYHLEEEVGGEWRTLLAGEEPVTDGVHAVFVDAEDRAHLGDFDVELSENSALADPIVWPLRSGASLEVLFTPLPGGRSAMVEAIAARSVILPGETMELLLPGMGPLDRAATAVAQAVVVFRTAPGEETVHAWRGRSGRPCRLRLSFAWSPPSPDAGPGVLLRSLLFHRAPPDRRKTGHLLRPADAEVEEGDGERFGAEEEVPCVQVEDRIRDAMASLDGEGGCTEEMTTEGGVLVLTGRRARAVGDEVVREMETAYLPILVEVEARGTGAKDGVIFAASGPFVPGTWVCLFSDESRSFIQDWAVEVARGSWIPDPQVNRLQTGDYMNLRLVAGADGRPDAVDLDFRVTAFGGFAVEDLPILDSRDRTGGAPGGAAAGSPKRAALRIEKPLVREVRIAGRYPLAKDGTVTIRRAVPGPDGPEGGLILAVKVSPR